MSSNLKHEHNGGNRFVHETERIHQLMNHAKDGDAKAMAELGECYILGIGVEKSEEKGYTMISEASDNNDELATGRKADCLFMGIGVDQNFVEANETIYLYGNWKCSVHCLLRLWFYHHKRELTGAKVNRKASDFLNLVRGIEPKPSKIDITEALNHIKVLNPELESDKEVLMDYIFGKSISADKEGQENKKLDSSTKAKLNEDKVLNPVLSEGSKRDAIVIEEIITNPQEDISTLAGLPTIVSSRQASPTYNVIDHMNNVSQQASPTTCIVADRMKVSLSLLILVLITLLIAKIPSTITMIVQRMGFTRDGIQPGSIAAKMMSAAAAAGNGGVAKGGMVATLQSIGATGLGLLGSLIAMGIGLLIVVLLSIAVHCHTRKKSSRAIEGVGGGGKQLNSTSFEYQRLPNE